MLAKFLFTTEQGAILLGSVLIAMAILISGGTIKINGINNQKAVAVDAPAVPSTLPDSQPPDGQATPTPPAKINISLGNLSPKGNNSAQVAVVEFGDLRCPFCKKFFDDSESQLLSEYVTTGKIKFAFRQYQFLGPASVTAGNAVACANDQDKFWEMHDYLYKNQPDESDTSLYTNDKLTAIAGTLGLNTTKFSSCIASTKFSADITKDQSDGQQAGVTGTPSFVIGKLDSTGTKIIGGQLIVGAVPYTQLKTAIDQQLSQ